jgi:hypothetical protein
MIIDAGSFVEVSFDGIIIPIPTSKIHVFDKSGEEIKDVITADTGTGELKRYARDRRGKIIIDAEHEHARTFVEKRSFRLILVLAETAD